MAQEFVHILLNVTNEFRDETAQAASVAKYPSRADFIREAAEVFARIPGEDLERLRRLAQKAGFTLSSVIREAIQPYLAVDQPGSILPILRELAAKERSEGGGAKRPKKGRSK